MKYINLYAMAYICLFSLPCFANQVPLSEAERYISAMPNGVPPLYTCSDKPEEPCFDASSIIWEYAEIVTVHDTDPETGINTPRKVLQNSEEKKVKILKDIEDAKLAKIAQKLKAKADINKASTIAQLRKAMEDYIETLENP